MQEHKWNEYSPKRPEMYIDKVTGWNQFNPEVSWFIYDFFKHELNGYEKLLFYCYYIQGMTLIEIAFSADCTFQYIGKQIKNIEKRLGYRWKNKKDWRVATDECSAGNRRSSRRDKAGNKSGC